MHSTGEATPATVRGPTVSALGVAGKLTPRVESALRELRAAAMEADPSIQGMWTSYEDIDSNGFFLLAGVVFVRRDRPAFAEPEPRETISSLFPQWVAAHAASDADEDDGERHYAEYVRLQRRITALRPGTAREAAMQLVVETDDGGSDYREAFFRRVRKLALEG